MKNLILIRVNKVIDYRPLSKSSSKNKIRMEQLQYLSDYTGVDIDTVVETFAMYLAKIIRDRAKYYISKQTLGRKKMINIYPELSIKYRKRKVKSNMNKFWVNTEYLVNSIRSWTYGKRKIVFVGVPDYIKHPDSKSSVSDIIMWMEKGTKKMPARPLIFPIVKIISRHIDEYFTHFFKLVMSNKIKFRK